MAKRNYAAPKRPVDKESIFVRGTSIGTTQDDTAIRTSTVAETFSGGHISGSVLPVSGGGFMQLALIFRPEGSTTPTLTTTDAADLLSTGPVEWVLWADSFELGASQTEPFKFNAKIKTMRKMKNGDSIRLEARGSVATVGTYSAIVTLFFKQ